MRKLLNWLVVLSLAGFISACAAVGTRDGNIAEVAQKNGFTALLAAVDKAGIASTLTDPKANLTVFAPTDAAFNTLATQLGFANAGEMVGALSASDLAAAQADIKPAKLNTTSQFNSFLIKCSPGLMLLIRKCASRSFHY